MTSATLAVPPGTSEGDLLIAVFWVAYSPGVRPPPRFTTLGAERAPECLPT